MLLHARIHTIMTKTDFLEEFDESLEEAKKDIKDCSRDLSDEFAMRQTSYWRGYLRGTLSQAYRSGVITTDIYLEYWTKVKSTLDVVIGEVLFHA